MEFRYYTHHPMVDYANSMDPGAYDKGPQKPSTSIKDIGMSVPLGISAQNVAGIYSKIRMGAGSIELAFPTQGTGNRNAHTPEMYGTDQRQAIRELANINEVKLTTHAAYNVMGMMGRDQRDNFSNTNAREGMREVERAIDFAADTAGAGSVVVHTGEWERPLTEMYLDDPTTKTNLAYDDEGRLMFKRTQQQVFDAQFTLLDDRTSQKMETAQKDRKISIPIWNRADRDYDGKYQEDIHVMHDKEKWMEKYVGKPAHIKKGDYIDYEGRKIIDPYNVKYGRVPDFDPDARTFKVEYQNWNYFIKEAQEQTNFNKAHWKDKTNKDWRDDPMWYYDGERHPDEAFMHATLETNEGHSRGWAIQFAIDSKNDLELLKKYEEARKYYQQLDKEIPEEEKWKLMRNKEFGDLIPPESKHPLELIEERLNQVRARLTYAKESSASQLQQAEDTAETKEHIVTPSKRFKLHAARFYAEAGIRAMQRTKDPNTPVFIAIENIFPERFGGHPEELKFVIDQSRKWMVDFL
ncbi:MAG TPA: hypothetical protein VFF28_07520, partial [Candidatus Nanoarchaeia archaeon]|nr:hypothetical protein [Candidatus Nanoarchaeia archaeon]